MHRDMRVGCETCQALATIRVRAGPIQSPGSHSHALQAAGSLKEQLFLMFLFAVDAWPLFACFGCPLADPLVTAPSSLSVTLFALALLHCSLFSVRT